MRITGHIFAIGLMVILLSACGKEKTGTLIFDNIVISAEGPLYEGANTAQGEVLNRINSFARELGIEPGEIHSALMKKFTLSVNDSTNFDMFNSINIEFASDKTDMMEAAAINKIPSGSKKLELTISGEQNELIEVLKQDKFTVVADALINKDSNVNIDIIGTMEIELKY